MPNCPEDLVPQERAAIVAWAFARGEQLTTRQVARKLGVSYLSAWFMLQKLSRVLPVAFDQQEWGSEGYWYAIS